MKKPLKIVVLAKQVPDTRNVGKDAMTPEGTVNRAALPAIFNPEDLNALEAALRLKDAVEGSTVHILTMGPQRAADIIRDLPLLEEARREAAKAVDKGMDFTEELRHRFGGAFFKKMEEAEKE